MSSFCDVLQVLCLDHPPHMIRDTALYAPLQQIACTVRPSLRALAKLVLNKDVQSGEHSAVRPPFATSDSSRIKF